ncbi:MAG TPA: C-type lectin domain-containing protein [Phycisphaerales bacterium]|nr:C-type lectin domain-containing protein [Phycisphaerales bacterium]
MNRSNFQSLALVALALVAGNASAQSVVRGPIQRPGDESRYYVVQGANWSQMRAFAQSMGGDLATVNDASEQSFIMASVINANEKVFIGLNDAAVEGAFVWADGSTSTYRNFPPLFSNSATQDFVLIAGASGQWNAEPAAFTPFGLVEIRGPLRVPAEVATLRDAMLLANIRETTEILLGPGTFTLDSHVDVRRSMTIRGTGVGVTTVQSSRSSSPWTYVYADLLLENLTIVQRGGVPVFILSNPDTTLHVRNAEVTSSVGVTGGELVMTNVAPVVLESALIHNIGVVVQQATTQASATFLNCVIRDVLSATRSLAPNGGTPTKFVNCTITRVEQTLTSAAGNATFFNTVVLGEPNVYNSAQVVNSVFTNTDPGLVNAAANDFRLLPTSSLIDGGSTSSFLRAMPADFVDLAGNPRGVDVENVPNTGSGALALDIGAYEFQGEVGCDDIDFNNNGVFPEDQDVIDFFTVLAGGDCPQ